MRNLFHHVITNLALAIGLSACGGGESIVSAPVPPPVQTPSPPPSPPPPPEGPIGLVSDEPFTVLGVSMEYERNLDPSITVGEPERASISFEYRASDDVYLITLPDYQPGALVTRWYSGGYRNDTAWQSVYGTTNELLDGETGRQDALVFLHWPSGPLNPDNELSYTSWGTWGDDADLNGNASSGTVGHFAYGIATRPGDMPVTGSASYSAQIIGQTNQAYESGIGMGLTLDQILGTANLRFDFGAGTLEGEMNPSICPWECYSLGTYTFVETIFATGSTSFSGQFAINGETVPSWFEGSFNGPAAAELMARWQAPFTSGGLQGTMGGIWVGKKD